MDRRAFFRRGLTRASQAAVDGAEALARRNAAHWIRPPYALDELEFLLSCTRCSACIEACPHGVVFALPARRGAKVVGTPALDLLNHGCRMCEDWPCVTACESGSLRLPKPETHPADPEQCDPIEAPRLAVATIDTAACLPWSGPECGACRGSCPVLGALTWEREKPRIDPEQCTGCGLCREACIVEPKAVTIRSLHAAAPNPANSL